MSDNSGRNFNVDDEAKFILHLAKERLDTSNTFGNYPTSDGRAAAKRLAEEWVSLDQDQRVQVANTLTTKYHNGDMTANPVPNVVTNMNGEMIGLQFEASFWDWNPGPANIKLLATNGNVSESRSCRVVTDDQITEYIGKDPFGVKNGQTQQESSKPRHVYLGG